MNYVIAILSFTLIISLYFNKSFYDENNKLMNDLSISKSNEYNLESKIISQNDKLEDLRVNYDENIKKFYKDIQNQKVIIKEVKSNECEDIKSIIDDIRKFKP